MHSHYFLMIEKLRYNKGGRVDKDVQQIRSRCSVAKFDVLPVNTARFCRACSQRTKSLWCPPRDWQAGRWWWPARQRRTDSLWNNWSRCACGGSSTLQNKLNRRYKVKTLPPQAKEKKHSIQICFTLLLEQNESSPSSPHFSYLSLTADGESSWRCCALGIG